MTSPDPLLIDVPERLDTARFIVRSPRRGDGPKLNEGVCASIEDLKPWMPWAQTAPSQADSEIVARRAQARFLLREDLTMFIFERTRDGSEGALVGGTGLHRMDWTVRRFEIGYWRRSGHEGRGIIGEVVKALTDMAFEALSARRVEIRMDDHNQRSRAVAERAGYRFEGLLRDDALSPSGQVRSTRIYALCASDAP